jgi:hypothetical protein
MAIWLLTKSLCTGKAATHADTKAASKSAASERIYSRKKQEN